MDFDQYRQRMDAAHQEFSSRVTDMLLAYGQTQQVFGDTLRDIERHIQQNTENDAELKKLILEQGQELREQRAEIHKQSAELRAMRERLDGGAR